MKKDFDLLLKVISEEMSDTMNLPGDKEYKKFILELYKNALKDVSNLRRKRRSRQESEH